MKNLSSYKIGLVGAGGSGKTTLMYAWANEVCGKVLNQSSKDVMDVFGFNNHKDIIKASVNIPEVGINFQLALAQEKNRLIEETKEGFITDRSLIDIFAYYIAQNSVFASRSDDSKMAIELEKYLQNVDVSVFMSPPLNEIEDNGIRSTSPYHYTMISNTMQHVINSYLNNVKEKTLTNRIVLEEYNDIYANTVATENHLFVAIVEPKGITTTSKRIDIIKEAIHKWELAKSCI